MSATRSQILRFLDELEGPLARAFYNAEVKACIKLDARKLAD